jgi:hypothetical protein
MTDPTPDGLEPLDAYREALHRVQSSGPRPGAPATEATDSGCSCGGRFPLQHLHADEHMPVEAPARTTPDNPATSSGTADNPPAVDLEARIADRIEQAVYEYREQACQWDETDGSTQAIAARATRAALRAVRAELGRGELLHWAHLEVERRLAVEAQTAEAAVERATTLAETWQEAPDPLARAMAADLLSAIRGPQQRNRSRATNPADEGRAGQ